MNISKHLCPQQHPAAAAHHHRLYTHTSALRQSQACKLQLNFNGGISAFEDHNRSLWSQIGQRSVYSPHYDHTPFCWQSQVVRKQTTTSTHDNYQAFRFPYFQRFIAFPKSTPHQRMHDILQLQRHCVPLFPLSAWCGVVLWQGRHEGQGHLRTASKASNWWSCKT